MEATGCRRLGRFNPLGRIIPSQADCDGELHQAADRLEPVARGEGLLGAEHLCDMRALQQTNPLVTMLAAKSLEDGATHLLSGRGKSISKRAIDVIGRNR